MASARQAPVLESVASPPSARENEPATGGDDTITTTLDLEQGSHTRGDQDRRETGSPSPPPEDVPPFDWENFEASYEKALMEANAGEKDILKQAESLSKYFKAWASAASAHDDDRAIKRLRTRQRFVNLREHTMDQKQKHYEEVVRAFESALALLKST